ncbi:Venom allergen 5 [Schistosoma japonicum]|uniref:Venom allergen 5 n=1 Tax=Schistosoma japonicum TaxID=6182 RepID=A0A4Z2DFI1_SCHJA|nr:Venom allergen 5 [Schistosoma japonicum]
MSSMKALLSICLLVCPSVYTMIDEGTKVRLLTLHNDARKSVVEGKLMGQPMAISMEPLKWDRELERKAQILADNCSFAHDNVTNRSTSSFEHVGQNIARADSVDIGNLIGQVPYRLKIKNKLIKPEIQNCNVRKYTYPLITFVPRLGPSLIKPLHSPNVSRI